MKSLFSKLASRLTSSKFLLTAGTIGYGVILIRQGDVTEGVALIAGATGTYNVGQGLADSKPTPATAQDAANLAAPIAGQN
jgi:hypothetical protein